MPTYDYRCGSCKHEFELFQSMTEKPRRKCPKCGKAALNRLIGTGAAVMFKGSGFYQTDYRSESYKKSAEADKPDKGKDAAANGKPAESKPAPAEPASPAVEKKPAKPRKSQAKDR